MKLEVVNEEDEMILSVIDNPDEDIKKICKEFKIKQYQQELDEIWEYWEPEK